MGYGQLINGVHRASLHSTNNTQISDQSEAHSTPQYTHTHAHRTVTQKRKINRQMIKYAIWIWPKTRSIYFHQMLCLCNFICFFSLSLYLVLVVCIISMGSHCIFVWLFKHAIYFSVVCFQFEGFSFFLHVDCFLLLHHRRRRHFFFLK